MRCTSPRTVGFKPDGKTISWSQKSFSKEYASFQLPCGKCIECRLDYARQWAVRCVHEAQMHPSNCFVTLTYDEDHLSSPRLNYEDFQLFMKRLRKVQDFPIGYFVTGEYGEKTKRPHWHAILFNYRPRDAVYYRTTENGDKCFTSETLRKIWSKGMVEFGDVTFQSAGYCARYSAKKLIHGKDGEHEFNPISKKSKKNAIGKKWIERYWPDVFTEGRVRLRDGSSCGIPRYYEKWFKENLPEQWFKYVTEVKPRLMFSAETRSEKEKLDYFKNVFSRLEQKGFCSRPLTNNEIRNKIAIKTFEDRLQKYLKL